MHGIVWFRGGTTPINKDPIAPPNRLASLHALCSSILLEYSEGYHSSFLGWVNPQYKFTKRPLFWTNLEGPSAPRKEARTLLNSITLQIGVRE